MSRKKENDRLTFSTALDLRCQDIALSEKMTSTRIKRTVIAEMKHLDQENQGRYFQQPENFLNGLRGYLEKDMLQIDRDPLHSGIS